MSEQTFAHGDGVCGFNCTNGDIGCGGCCFTTYCPCFALCNAANDAKLSNGNLYCIMTTCGCGCCALMKLGEDIEEKRGLRKHDGCWHCMHSCCNCCTCHSCRVVNECKVYAKDGAVNAAPTGTQMTR
ncbi:hypothetical protein ACHAXM_009617 [Skeletonema potamos]